MFFGLQLDRGNIQNALTDDLLADLNITSNDYNYGTTIQLVSFLTAEFPVQFLTKRYGFRRVLPILMMCWSTVSWAQAFMTNRSGFFITRVSFYLSTNRACLLTEDSKSHSPARVKSEALQTVLHGTCIIRVILRVYSLHVN